MALLAGHDDLTNGVLSQGLGRLGYEIHVAQTFERALEVVATHGPKVVVTELKFPDGAGLDLLSIIKVNQPDARVIIATSFASIATTVRAIKWGAEDYLVKPVSLESIVQAVECRPCQCTPEGLPVEAAPQPISDRLTLSRLTWEHIHRVLQEAGSVSRAARLLGVDRRSLRRTLSKHSPPEKSRVRQVSSGR